MLNTRPIAPSRRRSLAGTLVVLTLTLAACSSATGPSPSPSPADIPTPKATPTAVPGDVGSGNPGGGTGGNTDPGSGGGSGGNTGTGILPPGIVFPVAPVPDESLLGDANYLTPTPGLLNPRNVNVQLVRAGVGSDGHTYVDLRWYSGVAPCNMLDSVKVAIDNVAKTVHLVVVEGSGPGDAMCIEIAELHATAVDLGILEPGSWTISAEGDAPAITLDIE